jgi:hypothetical protein
VQPFAPYLTFVRKCLYNLATRRAAELKFSPADIENLKEIDKFYGQSLDLTHRVPTRQMDSAALASFLMLVPPRVQGLRKGDMIVLPGGWCGAPVPVPQPPPGTPAAAAPPPLIPHPPDHANNNHNMCYVLERKESTFSFTVVNTGDGLNYHIVSATAEPPILQYRPTITLDDIPIGRLSDSTFWYMLFKLQTWPSQLHTPKFLYETLLPYLNNKPVLCNLDAKDPGDFVRRTNSPWDAAIESVHYVCRRRGFSPAQVQHIGVVLRWELCRMVADDLRYMQALTGSEVCLIRLACQGLAMTAAKAAQQPGCVIPNGHLIELKQCIEAIGKHVQSLPVPSVNSPALPPELKLDGRPAPFVPFPLWDRLRRDDPIEGMAGVSEVAPIFRPVQLTLIQDTVTSYNDVANALRHCDNQCTLLSYQTDQIKNTYQLRVALIQHLFTRVIPMPLPHDHPRKHLCMWSQPIRYETQVLLSDCWHKPIT